MNIKSLVEKCQNFDDVIIGRGYQRDLQGFQHSLAQASQNLVVLQDISGKIQTIIDGIYQSSVPDDMVILLPKEKNYQFVIKKYPKMIADVRADTQLPIQQIHGMLTALNNNLIAHISSNKQQIDQFMSVILPYYKQENESSNEAEKAVLAVVFNNDRFYKTIPDLSKSLSKWRKVFSIYTQLMTSIPYKEVEITSIRDRSVEFIFNFDIDLSMDLTEIFKYGLSALGGYVEYIKKTKDIIESYLGNEKLIKMETERKKMLLNNVYEVIVSKIKEKHKIACKKDLKINQESVDKKIETVSKIITEHLIAGNGIRLLWYDEKTKDIAMEIKEKSQILKKELKNLDADEIKLLESKYSIEELEKPFQVLSELCWIK